MSPQPTPSQHETGPSKSFGRYLPVIARIILGLIFFVFGLNGFLNFIPQPKTALPAFIVALFQTGYMIQLISATELVGGLLLLGNRFVPLGLALLAPVIVNVLPYHIFLDQSGLPIAIVVVLLEIYLAWAYRAAFRPMLAARATTS